MEWVAKLRMGFDATTSFSNGSLRHCRTRCGAIAESDRQHIIVMLHYFEFKEVFSKAPSYHSACIPSWFGMPGFVSTPFGAA